MKVNLWFARDKNNEIVSIIDKSVNSKDTYICPICSSKVIPKAIDSKKITPHFAHMDVTKCNSESMIHFWMKHKFIERGDTFKIKTNEEIEFTCNDLDVEVTFQLESGTYRPDLVIYTECGQEIIFEMANSNKKKVQDYIDRWIELDRIVVEVDIKSLQNENNVKVLNALYYKGRCFNFNKRDGGYYNTIGKLKEEMKRNSCYDIELVKKLDWFWKEITSADNYESAVLFNNYRSIQKSLRQKIIDIIKIKNCTKYFHKIFNYEASLMKELFNNTVPKELHLFFKFELIIKDSNKTVDSNYGGIMINCIFTGDRVKTFNFGKYKEMKEYLDECVSAIFNSKEYKIYKFIENSANFSESLDDIRRNIARINPNVNILLNSSLKELDMSSLIVEFTDLGFYYNIKLDIDLIQLKDKNDIYLYLESKVDYLKAILPSDDKNKKLFNEITSKYKEVSFDVITEYANMIIFKQGIYSYAFIAGILYKFNSFYSQATFNNIDYLNSALKNTTILARNKSQIEDVIEELFSESIICKECGEIFNFNYEESKYFSLKGLSNPKRCKPCRKKRRLKKKGRLMID